MLVLSGASLLERNVLRLLYTLYCLTNERVIYMLQYNSVGVQLLPNILRHCVDKLSSIV